MPPFYIILLAFVGRSRILDILYPGDGNFSRCICDTGPFTGIPVLVSLLTRRCHYLSGVITASVKSTTITCVNVTALRRLSALLPARRHAWPVICAVSSYMMVNHPTLGGFFVQSLSTIIILCSYFLRFVDFCAASVIYESVCILHYGSRERNALTANYVLVILAS